MLTCGHEFGNGFQDIGEEVHIDSGDEMQGTRVQIRADQSWMIQATSSRQAASGQMVVGQRGSA